MEARNRPIDVEELLQCTGWLRSLARSLSADASTADDLAQEALVSALTSREGYRVGLRAWLGRIVRNHARSADRSRVRRLKREAASASREELPSTGQLLARNEVSRLLLASILSLPRGQQQVVTMHYLEGLSVADVSQALALSEVAVRSRLARAIEALRADLDRRCDGDRSDWFPSLLLLAREPARLAPEPDVGAAAAGPILKTALILAVSSTQKLVASAFALVLLALVLWSLRDAGSTPSVGSADAVRGTDAATERIASGHSLGDELVPVAERVPARTSTDDSELEPPEVTAFSGRVVDALTGAPIAAAKLSVFQVEEDRGPVEGGVAYDNSTSWQLTTDEEGRFHRDADGAGVVAVEVSADGYAPSRRDAVVVGESAQFGLHPATLLRVVVQEDPRGDGTVLRPLAGTTCRLVINGHDRRRRTIQEAVTDASGALQFRSRGSEAHIIVELPGRPSVGEIHALEPGQDELTIVVKPIGVARGRVIDRVTRLPIAGVRLTELNRDDVAVTTDLDGWFEVPNDAAENSAWRITHDDYGDSYLRIRPQASNEAELPEIELDACAVLTGVVQGFDGAVRVTAVSQETWFVHQRIREAVTLQQSGLLRMKLPSRMTFYLEARDSRGNVGWLDVTTAPPGGVSDFGSLAPRATAALRGAVSGLDEASPAIVRVRIRRDQLFTRDLVLPVRDGAFSAAGLPAGRCEVWAEQGAASGIVETLDLRDEEHELVLQMGGRISGVVAWSTGQPIEDALVMASSSSGAQNGRGRASTDENGRFEIAGLVAGHRYDVRVRDLRAEAGDVEPKSIEVAASEGPPLQFVARRDLFVIEGSVAQRILEELPREHLRVRCACGQRSATTSIRADGTFVVSVPVRGPWDLELVLLDVSGDSLDVLEVSGVDRIHGAIPGLAVMFGD